jgi:hypothetical protein
LLIEVVGSAQADDRFVGVGFGEVLNHNLVTLEAELRTIWLLARSATTLHSLMADSMLIENIESSSSPTLTELGQRMSSLWLEMMDSA